MANDDEPIGVPSNLKPLVSLTGVVVWELLAEMFFLLEKVAMEYSMSDASSGDCFLKSGRMLSLLQLVKIHVFDELMKQPRSLPNWFSRSRKNRVSSRDTVAERSSRYPKECVIPPQWSSPGCPVFR